MTEITNEMVSEQVMGWGKSLSFFYPMSDAGDDFMVLDKSREWFKSDDFMCCVFWAQLAKILRSRSPHTSEDFRDIHLMHYYEVGDYSRAAMAAVAARRERNNRGMLGSSIQKEVPQ